MPSGNKTQKEAIHGIYIYRALKKLALAVTAGALVFGMVSCGGDDGDGDGTVHWEAEDPALTGFELGNPCFWPINESKVIFDGSHYRGEITAQSKVWMKPDMNVDDLPTIMVDVYPIPTVSSLTSDAVGKPIVTKVGTPVSNVTAFFELFSFSPDHNNGTIMLFIHSSVNTAALLKTVLASLSGATVTMPAAAGKDLEAGVIDIPAFGVIDWPTLELKILKAGDSEIGANNARLLPAGSSSDEAGAKTKLSGTFSGNMTAAADDIVLICNGTNVFLLGKDTTNKIYGKVTAWDAVASASKASAYGFPDGSLGIESSKSNTPPVIHINKRVTDEDNGNFDVSTISDRCRVQIEVDADGTVRATNTWRAA